MSIFNFKTREPDRIRKDPDIHQFVEDVPKEEKYKRVPLMLKIGARTKIILSDIDPFKAISYILILGFLSMFIIGFVLPWFEVIEEVPNKIPIFTALGFFTIGYFLCDIQNRRIRERVCELSIGAKTFLTDNSKVDIYEGGEIIYLVNYYGRPMLCKDEANMRRWAQQQNIFIPKQVLEQFGSISGRRAKAFPDCRIKTVYMKDIDRGVLYIPKQLSETRLLKKLEVADENIVVLSEMIEKFKENAMRIASDMREFESGLLKGLIKDTSSLQEAFFDKTKMREVAREVMYGSRYQQYPGSKYSKYGSRYPQRSGPLWHEVTPGNTPPTQPPVEEE
jgi:hypothetical protein